MPAVVPIGAAAALSTYLLAVAEASDRAVLIADEQGRIEYANPCLLQMYGETAGDAALRSITDLLLADSPGASQWLRDAARLESWVQYGLTQGQGGQRYWTRLASQAARDDSGQRRLIVFVTDVTGGRLRKAVQRPVLEALARDESVLDAMNLICREIEELVPDARLALYHRDEADTLHPLASPSLAEVAAITRTGEDACSEVRLFFGALLDLGEDVFTADVSQTPFCGLQGLAPDSTSATPPERLACWAVPVKSSGNVVLGVLACLGPWQTRPDPFLARIVEDCGQVCMLALERHQARLKLDRLAYYDTLTGLPNRRQLQLMATQMIEKLAYRQQPMAVIFMDVNRLKHVNDSLGFTAGDHMLRTVAQRLSSFSDAALVARLSGDEFALAMPVASPQEALSLAERLQAALSEPLEVAGMRLEVGISMGIGMYPDDGHDVEALLHRASAALHQAKIDGGGRYGFFSQDMNQASHGRLVMEAALRTALRTSQLELYYQPQVRVADGQLYGAEALLRWRHPQWGMIRPDQFIPLAEEQGLMTPLGLWVMGEACRQLQAWRAQGLAVPAVSINMSASSLRGADFAQQVADTLAAHGLSPQDLRIEVTESVMLNFSAETMMVVRAIENLGVRLSMDDFGTGYSSWGYLNRLPLDEIKLDKSFVQAVAHDEISRILCKAVVRLGEAMSLTVVAEGVETREHFEFLRQQGFDIVQGYWIARPMCAPDFERWLAASGNQPFPDVVADDDTDAD